MKKLLTLLGFFVLSFSLQAQIIYSDDFESYPAGEGIVASANNDFWHTETDDPNHVEDAPVIDSQSVSGDQSLYISGYDQSVILKFSEVPIQEGRFVLSFNLMVDTCKSAFYSLMHAFEYPYNFSAVYNYFNADRTPEQDYKAKLYNIESSLSTFTFNPGEWAEVYFVIDLDVDLWTFYYDNQEIYTGKFSTAFEDDKRVNSLHALRFSTYGTGCSSSYYIDDLVLEHIPKPTVDWQLKMETMSNEDNALNWTEVPDAVEYIIWDGIRKVNTTTQNTWSIGKLYPANHEYYVWAKLPDNGYWSSHDTLKIQTEGGIDRDFVLVELATTNMDCRECRTIREELGYFSLERVGLIQYFHHEDDPWYVDDGRARIDYYNVEEIPSLFFNGPSMGEKIEGFGINNLTYFLDLYQARFNRKMLYTIDVDLYETLFRNYRLEISINELFEYFEGEKKVKIALIENDLMPIVTLIDENILRKMYPDANGMEMELTNGKWNDKIEFFVPVDYNIDKCELIVFLQDEDSKEVLTGTKIKLSDAFVAVNEVLSESIDVYPNPATNYIELQGLQKGAASIQSINGQTVMNFDVLGDNQKVDVGALQAGAYVLNIQTQEGLVVKKFIKK